MPAFAPNFVLALKLLSRRLRNKAYSPALPGIAVSVYTAMAYPFLCSTASILSWYGRHLYSTKLSRGQDWSVVQARASAGEELVEDKERWSRLGFDGGCPWKVGLRRGSRTSFFLSFTSWLYSLFVETVGSFRLPWIDSKRTISQQRILQRRLGGFARMLSV